MPKKPNKVKRPWIVERKPFERAVDNSEFYNSRAWRNLRRRVLDANPLCVKCNEVGRVTAATVGDHIVPITQGGAALDEANIQGLCKECHNAKSARERYR